MKSVLNCLFFIFFTLFCVSNSFAQGDRCERIKPFCAGDTQFVFPNSNKLNSDIANAEAGPDYSCLEEQSYPAWFFMKIGKPGDLNFEITQTINADGSGLTLDVDYAAWGPFREGEDFCSDSALSDANAAGCSYSPAPIENFNLKGARTGDIYVVLITNFSQAEGYISLKQVNTASPNAGNTDCSIISLLGEDQNVCGLDSVELKLENLYADVFTWYKKDASTGIYVEILNETTSKYSANSSGDYRVVAINALTNTQVSDDVSIQFNDAPIAQKPEDLSSCSINNTAKFNLSSLTPQLSANYIDTIDSFSATFYKSQADLNNDISIENANVYEGVDGQILLATITNNRTGCISKPVSFQLKIEDSLEIDWNDSISTCVDANGKLLNSFSIGQDLGDDYIYNWTPDNDPDGDGVENAIFVVDEIDASKGYSVEISSLSSGCTAIFNTTVLSYTVPTSIEVNTSGNDFDDGYLVEVSVIKGVGDEPPLEYRLDDGIWQQSNNFNDVPAGFHTVSARVVGGCGSITSEEFVLIGYPRFFTPNGDGYNDRWNVINDEKVSYVRLFIYDRFGKLLKQLNPNVGGWNGTYNGKNLPSDDYWFVVELQDASRSIKQFKGHFTLKR
ncbi:T9SS type B sorting domain-containing protein [Gillisia sp. Hel_I_29]|uniref:T9SS type B sorting domain-containing protein n=1 Tax=Gillisia sp. Hel_I_29 TaxID=1249975 RepID=UPI0006913411|nr:T9SS type B sorting domain-containing protein [Gillisia sp. Hel_I_29]